MKRLKIVILVIVCVGLAVGYYYYLSTHTRSDSDAKKAESELSEVDLILTDDLDADYPPTPREVVKYYNRIITCYYSGECSDEQVEDLAKVQQKLLDEGLLENNPWETYVENIKADIAKYQKNETVILDSTVCDSDDIEYKEVEGRECAYVTSDYLLKQGKGSTKIYQEYALREDGDGRWKIVAFQLADKDGGE